MWTRVISWGTRLRVSLGCVAGWVMQPLRPSPRPGDGQSTVEYAVITALIVVAVMAGIQYFTQGVTTVFQHIVQTITKL